MTAADLGMGAACVWVLSAALMTMLFKGQKLWDSYNGVWGMLEHILHKTWESRHRTVSQCRCVSWTRLR